MRHAACSNPRQMRGPRGVDTPSSTRSAHKVLFPTADFADCTEAHYDDKMTTMVIDDDDDDIDVWLASSRSTADRVLPLKPLKQHREHREHLKAAASASAAAASAAACC